VCHKTEGKKGESKSAQEGKRGKWYKQNGCGNSPRGRDCTTLQTQRREQFFNEETKESSSQQHALIPVKKSAEREACLPKNVAKKGKEERKRPTCYFSARARVSS